MPPLLFLFYLFHLLFIQFTSSTPVYLEGKSFSITCSISLLKSSDQANGNTRSYRVFKESYSTTQERAQIEIFKEDDEPITRVFFLETRDQQENALVLEGENGTCIRSNISEIKSHLLLDSDPFKAIDVKVPSYIVGVAKLLYFIEFHKDGFEVKGSTTVNDLRVTNYSFKYLSPTYDQSLKIEAIYSGPWRADSEIPIRVTLICGTTSLTINFSNFDVINSFMGISEHKNSFSVSNQVSVDRFAFPPIEGCINTIYSSAKPIFEHKFKNKRNAKFSFEARFITRALEARTFYGNAEFSHIVKVSYDGSLDTLLYKEEDELGVFKQLLNFRRLRMYQALDETNSNATPKCVVTKIPKPEPDVTLGDLLAGSNFFLDLGRSRVRGIPCRIFAAKIKSLPYWIEQPIKFSTLNDTSRIRTTDGGKGRALLHVNEEDLSPVRLVIYQEKTQHIVRFYNFIWDLDSSIRPSEQFTLENVCSLTNEERFQVDLAMIDDLKEFEKYSKPQLELTYLKSIQDNLGVPVNMVYDLETKLEVNLDSKDKLLTTFHVSAQSNTLTECVFLGQGYANPIYSDKLFQLPLRSFQLCMWLGAIKGRYFGYNAPQRHCVVDISGAAENQEENPRSSHIFIIDPGSRMEVYRIKSLEDPAPKLYWTNSRWENEESRQKFKAAALKNRIELFGKPYLIESVKITPIGTDSSETSSALGEGKRYNGYGLKNEKPNKIIDPVKDDEGLSTEMSYGQCHLACISNFRCQSFSICLREYRTECIVSPFSFKGADMTPLLEAGNNFSQRTSTIKLEDGSKVELVKHSSCALYHKNSLELFNKKQTNTASGTWLSHQEFVRVDNVESCAKFCVDTNLEILNQEMTHNSRLEKLLDPRAIEGSNRDKVQTILNEHKLNLNRFCYSFHFVEKGITTNTESVERFCSIGSSIDNATPIKLEMKNLDLDIYEFRMELLYESQTGVHLEGYELGLPESTVYSKIKRGMRIHNEEAYKSLLKIIEDGNNLQEYSQHNELECAKACFTQSLGPWPACRSFDIMTDLKTPFAICKLNSITLNQAYSKKPNLILTNSSRIRTAKHYEPRPGLSLDEALLDETIHLEVEPVLFVPWALDFFLLTCSMCLAIVSGLAGTCLIIKFVGQRKTDAELLGQD